MDRDQRAHFHRVVRALDADRCRLGAHRHDHPVTDADDGTAGLAAEDVVVTAGQMKLHEGARVRVIDEGAPAKADKGVS